MISTLQAGVTYLLARSRHEDGAVASEYAFLLFLVAIAIVAAVAAYGTALFGLFDESETTIKSVTG